jgi:hypothetical protein
MPIHQEQTGETGGIHHGNSAQFFERGKERKKSGERFPESLKSPGFLDFRFREE